MFLLKNVYNFNNTIVYVYTYFPLFLSKRHSSPFINNLPPRIPDDDIFVQLLKAMNHTGHNEVSIHSTFEPIVTPEKVSFPPFK